MVRPIGFGPIVPLMQAAGSAGAGGVAPAGGGAAPVGAAPAPKPTTPSEALKFVADLWVPIKATDMEGRRSLRAEDARLQHWYYPKLGAALAAEYTNPRARVLRKLSQAQTASQFLIAITNASRSGYEISGDEIKQAAVKLDPEFLKQSVKICLDNIINSTNYRQGVDADYYEEQLYKILTSPLRGGAERSSVVPLVIVALKSVREKTATVDAAASSLASNARFKLTDAAPVAGTGAPTVIPGAEGLSNAEKVRNIVKTRVMADDSSNAIAARAAIQEEADAQEVFNKADATSKPAAQKALSAARAKTDAAIGPWMKEFVSGKKADGTDSKDSKGNPLGALKDYVDFPTTYERRLTQLEGEANAALAAHVAGLKAGKGLFLAKAGYLTGDEAAIGLILVQKEFHIPLSSHWRMPVKFSADVGTGPSNLSGRPPSFIGDRARDAGAFSDISDISGGLEYVGSGESSIALKGGLIGCDPYDQLGLSGLGGATMYGVTKNNPFATSLLGAHLAAVSPWLGGVHFLGTVAVGNEVALTFNSVDYGTLKSGADKGQKTSPVIIAAGVEYSTNPKEMDESVVVSAQGEMKLSETNGFGISANLQVPLTKSDQLLASLRYYSFSAYNKEASGDSSAVWDDVNNWGAYLAYKHTFDEKLSLVLNASYANQTKKMTAGMESAGFDTLGNDVPGTAVYNDEGKYLQGHANLNWNPFGTSDMGFVFSLGVLDRNGGVQSNQANPLNVDAGLAFKKKF